MAPSNPTDSAVATISSYRAGKRPLPYWLLNVPEPQWPSQCPPFLTDISPRNLDIVNVPEAAFQRLTWPEVRRTIRANRIEEFRRAPLDHRNYLCYMARLKEEHGSVMEYVRDRRLRWTDLDAKGLAFEDPDDVKIIYNDWPYGIDKSIVHLCVWTKFPLDVDEKDPNGDLTPEMRGKIDGYVERTFGSRVPAENIIWFKNWAKLKSIHSMEHFHVMMKDPDMEFIKEITKGDSPASSQLSESTILD
ncbi:hypothetical protein HO173_004394 [Letharia columbiana]|uniref:N-acetylglucosamine-induced protein 1 n=1 Tax=Letharia columbiana TaxID=112416 RepID=A0A8H6FZ62_9LECA|nr:uncharacterized protein HO173_004394 [Letharia columbiana]KAF6237504.1 hypothetical protein HO173_004394 [Letharia columbiana]